MVRKDRLFLLLLVFLITHCTFIYGQFENDIDNLKGDVKSIEFSYFNFSDSQWEVDEIYKFNRNRDIFDKIVYTASNTTEKTTYKYNSNNKVYFESYSEDGYEKRTYEFLYDKEDKLLRLTSYSTPYAKKQAVEITKCMYNNNGLRIKTEVQTDTGKKLYQVVYEYNTNDKIILKNYLVHDSEYDYLEDASDHYFYDSKGNRTKHVNNFLCNIDTKYYSDDKLEKRVLEQMNKKECMYDNERAINTLYYNKEENLIKNVFVLEQSNGMKQPNSTSITTYDEVDDKGNWLSKYETHTNHVTGKTMKQGYKKRKITYY